MNDKQNEEHGFLSQANEWVVRAEQGLLDQHEQEAFARWRAADPRHERAAAQVEEVWQVAEGLRGDPAFAFDVTPAPIVVSSRRRVPRLWRWSIAASIMLLLVWGTSHRQQWWNQWQADYYSGTGDVRSVLLPDGSEVQLGSRTALVVDYTADSRRVRLLQGEAIFSPRPQTSEEPRAFVVQAAGASSTALGTRYGVRVGAAARAWVGVLQHSVSVRMDNPGSADLSQVVAEGQSVTISSQGVMPSGLHVEDETSWRRGMLVFNRQPFAYVVERLNQYREEPIHIVNPRLRHELVSAVFPLSSLNQVDTLIPLEKELDASLLRLPGMLLIY